MSHSAPAPAPERDNVVGTAMAVGRRAASRPFLERSRRWGPYPVGGGLLSTCATARIGRVGAVENRR